jgi:hypothetical protein
MKRKFKLIKAVDGAGFHWKVWSGNMWIYFSYKPDAKAYCIESKRYERQKGKPYELQLS